MARATTTPSANNVPVADGGGKIASGWVPNATTSAFGIVKFSATSELGTSTVLVPSELQVSTYVGAEIDLATSTIESWASTEIGNHILDATDLGGLTPATDKAASQNAAKTYIDTAVGGITLPTFGASLVDTANTVTLVNDSATPGNSKLYGTDDTGTKGWYDQPTGSGWQSPIVFAMDGTAVISLVDNSIVTTS